VLRRRSVPGRRAAGVPGAAGRGGDRVVGAADVPGRAEGEDLRDLLGGRRPSVRAGLQAGGAGGAGGADGGRAVLRAGVLRAVRLAGAGPDRGRAGLGRGRRAGHRVLPAGGVEAASQGPGGDL
ncbi:MAG: Phosphoribosylglycinamide formyltransferase, partial [uncultured Corynebacteriales bacterium]